MRTPSPYAKGIASRFQSTGSVLHALKAVLGAVDYGVLHTDLHHTSILCNEKFAQLFGIEAAEVVISDPETVREMVLSRIVDAEGWLKNLELIYDDPEREQEDELILTNPRAVLRRYTGPVRDESGQVVGRLWTFQDVTARWKRQQLEKLAAECLARFDPDPEVVFQHVVQAISAHYQSVVLVSVLEENFLKFYATAGVPAEHASVPGNYPADSYCQFCLSEAGPVIIQDAREHPDAKEILPTQIGFSRYLGVPLYDPTGQIIGTLCLMDAHSSEMLGDDDVRFMSILAVKLSSELERFFEFQRLRTGLAETSDALEKTQHQLVQSEKLAIAGTLSASIAHDIRNILASMSLQLSMAEENPDRAIQFTRDSLARFDVLAHRLLSYVKPSTTAFTPVDLAEIVRKVADLVGPQFVMAGVGLDIQVGEKPTSILADPGRIEHLLVNLTTNALQAIRRGGSVWVRIRDENEHVLLEVEDDGPGVAPEVATKLFEPFASTRSDGFGLGLFSCRQIVEAHSGTIEFVNNAEPGTLVQVRFRRLT